ncbi:MAG: ABC transporter substrate-binding protein [Candidatus Rokuibacteriota bacterium]
MSPILAKSGIPLIETLAAEPEITRAGPCTFRNRPLGVVEGRAGAEVTVTHHRAGRIAILTRDDELARTTSAAFAQHAATLGASVHSQWTYRPNESDFTGHLRRLRGGGFDLIYHASSAEDGARLTRAARALRIDVPLLGTARLDSARFFASAGAAAERTTFTTTFDRDDPRPISSDSSRPIASGLARTPTWPGPTPMRRRAFSSGPWHSERRTGAICAAR